MDRDDPAYAGQRDYNAFLLRLYDPIVVGFVGKLLWRVPMPALVDRYRERIRPNHLDVGPGTGWFLDRSGLADGSPVTILDPNPDVLTYVSRRLGSRFEMTSVEADVLKPLPVAGPFDSAALHMVIHCLPGPAERKQRAVTNVARVLAPDGILFGATVLGLDAPHTRLSRTVLRAFNRQGGFDNLEDSEASLRTMLDAEFEHVEVETVATVAIFAASGRRGGASSMAAAPTDGARA
jgi:SAM-dependent methyltransferase